MSDSRDQRFCLRWFFFRFTGSVPLDCVVALHLLRTWVGASCKDDVPYFGVRMADGALAFLVKFPVDGGRRGSHSPGTLALVEQTLQSRVTMIFMEIGCCKEYMHLNARDWIGTLDKNDNVADFGSAKLLQSFKDEMVPYLEYETLFVPECVT